MAAPAFNSSGEATGTPAATPTITSLAPTAGSDRVAVFVASWEAGSAHSPEDIASVSWAGAGAGFTKLGTSFNPDGTGSTHNACSMWYLLDTNFPGSAGNITVTMDKGTAANDLWIACGIWTGAAQEAPGTMEPAQGASPLNVAITTSVADCVLISTASHGGTNTMTATSGQTEAEQYTNGTTGMHGSLAYRVVTTAQEYTEQFSASSPSRFCSAVTFLKPAGAGGQTLSPTGIASLEAFGTAVISTGSVTLSPTGIASIEAFGTATVAAGAVTVSPTGIASIEAFGTATVANGGLILASAIASAEAFGTLTASPGAVTLLPTGIASGEAFGTAVLAGSVIILPGGIASIEAFGSGQLVPGAVVLSPSAIASIEAFGTALVARAGTLPSGLDWTLIATPAHWTIPDD